MSDPMVILRRAQELETFLNGLAADFGVPRSALRATIEKACARSQFLRAEVARLRALVEAQT